jgi:hypothetical protein
VRSHTLSPSPWTEAPDEPPSETMKISIEYCTV